MKRALEPADDRFRHLRKTDDPPSASVVVGKPLQGGTHLVRLCVGRGPLEAYDEYSKSRDAFSRGSR